MRTLCVNFIVKNYSFISIKNEFKELNTFTKALIMEKITKITKKTLNKQKKK